MYVLCIYCGFRKSEVLALTRGDVSLERGTISVNRTVIYTKGGISVGEPKSQSSRRTVVVPKDALRELREHIGQLESDQSLLFMTSSGIPVAPPNLVRMFKEEVAKAGLPKIRFHDLRHLHGTCLLLAGVDLKQIQSRLGHSQISTTADIYLHMLPSMDAEMADKFNDLLHSSIHPTRN